MINSKEEYREYIERDAIANWRTTTKCKIFGDEVWKFIIQLRKKEYYTSFSGMKKMIMLPAIVWNKYLFRRYSNLCGFTIPINVCEKGIALPHRGTIVINTTARIGENCRIHQGVSIGSTNGSKKSAIIGKNVFIGSGAQIIGEVIIEDDVAIGANAVVTRSILEKVTTWGGIPAKKISDKNSHMNLCPGLFGEKRDKVSHNEN